jgi:hypothetical protein
MESHRKNIAGAGSQNDFVHRDSEAVRKFLAKIIAGIVGVQFDAIEVPFNGFQRFWRWSKRIFVRRELYCLDAELALNFLQRLTRLVRLDCLNIFWNGI